MVAGRLVLYGIGPLNAKSLQEWRKIRSRCHASQLCSALQLGERALQLEEGSQIVGLSRGPARILGGRQNSTRFPVSGKAAGWQRAILQACGRGSSTSSRLCFGSRSRA